MRCLAIFLLVSTPFAVHARDPNRLVDFSLSDWRLKNAAVSALAKDESLAKWNLSLSVKDKIITIQGEVPDEETGKAAERAVKNVPGVASVINECRLRNPDDEAAKAIGREVRSRVEAKKEPKAEAKPEPAPVRPTADRHESFKPVVSLGEPEAVGVSNRDGAKFRVEVDRILKQAKYQGLTCDLRQGKAIISGRPTRMAAAWDLAEEIAELPNVDRVVFGPLSKR